MRADRRFAPTRGALNLFARSSRRHAVLGEVVYGRQRNSWRKWTGVDQPALLPAAEPLIVIIKRNFERNCDCLCSRVCLYLCLCLCLFLCLCAFVCACVYMSESVVSVSVCACVHACVCACVFIEADSFSSC